MENRVIIKPWFQPHINRMLRPNGISKREGAWTLYKIIEQYDCAYAHEVGHKLMEFAIAEEKAAEIAAHRDPDDEPAMTVFIGQDGVIGISK